MISIYTEMTPNPETMKFVANKLLYPGKSIDFPDESSAKPSPLAQELFQVPICLVSLIDDDADLVVGNAEGFASAAFAGLIDEATLYGRALSAAEVQAIRSEEHTSQSSHRT